MLSVLADNAEYALVRNASNMAAFSRTILGIEHSEPTEVHYLAERLTECLRDALLVAELRGERLGMEPDEDD